MQIKNLVKWGDISIPPLLLYTIFFFIGCYLRLWHLSSQVLLDDEWHALNFVLERPFINVVFQHGMGANSIPVNIWFWITLHTIGWSEIVLKLPSISASIFSLLLLPYLVKKLWGTLVSLIFAGLLATSPIVIFYSRIVRPFSPAMFFGTTSILLTLLWLRDGRKIYLYISGLAGFLAYYYHLYSVIPVAVTLLVAACASFKPVTQHIGLSSHSAHHWKEITITAVVVTALTVIFIVYPNLTNPWWAKVQGVSKSNLNTLLTFTELIVGTARYKLSYITFILIPLGCYLTYIRNKTQGSAIILPIIFFFTVIATYTQDGAHAGIQAARYGIVFFPLFFIIIAIAFDWIITEIQYSAPLLRSAWFPPFFLVLLWAPFLLASPLHTIYNSPNNFTNHSGFQYNYRPIFWENSPERELAQGISVNYNEIPEIYRKSQVHSRYKGIIEYPMVIGDHYNLLYYYQHFHRLPVVVGYTKKDFSFRAPPRAEWVYGDRTVDYIMSSIPENLSNNAVSWRSMVNIEQLDDLKKKYSGWLLILHKNPCREVGEHIQEFGSVGLSSPDLPTTQFMTNYLAKNLGYPMLQTNHIVAWPIP